jgi:hypothetical protein
MKKILIALAATTALAAAAAPAAAQSWRGDNDRDYRDNGRGYATSQRTTSYVDSLEWQINNAVQERRISRGEARQLLSDLRQVQPIAWKVQTGRASGWERQQLERTVQRIQQAVNDRGRRDRRDHRDDRDYGSGYGRDYRR